MKIAFYGKNMVAQNIAQRNIMIGNNAGYSFLEGKWNIFIGHNAGKEICRAENLFILKVDDTEYSTKMNWLEKRIMRKVTLRALASNKE